MIHKGPTNGRAASILAAALTEAYPEQEFELWPRRAVNAEYIVTVEWLNGPSSADVESLCLNIVKDADVSLVFRAVSHPDHMTIH